MCRDLPLPARRKNARMSFCGGTHRPSFLNCQNLPSDRKQSGRSPVSLLRTQPDGNGQCAKQFSSLAKCSDHICNPAPGGGGGRCKPGGRPRLPNQFQVSQAREGAGNGGQWTECWSSMHRTLDSILRAAQTGAHSYASTQEIVKEFTANLWYRTHCSQGRRGTEWEKKRDPVQKGRKGERGGRKATLVGL